MMIMEPLDKKIYDLATILGHLIEFHGSLLVLLFFYLLWGQFFFFSHSSSSQATWRVKGPKLMVFLCLAYFLSCQDFMRPGLHITLGEALQVTDLPLFPLIDCILWIMLHFFGTPSTFHLHFYDSASKL